MDDEEVQKDWPCHYCGKGFASRQSRHKHQQRAHGHPTKMKARCPICGAKDRNQRRHVERHHQDSEWFADAIAVVKLRRKAWRDMSGPNNKDYNTNTVTTVRGTHYDPDLSFSASI